ncbi:hypothetical protein ACFX1R_011215 [Malus domestica]
MARVCRYEHILPISVAMVGVLPDIPYKEDHVTQMVFLDKIAKGSPSSNIDSTYINIMFYQQPDEISLGSYRPQTSSP